jgi:DNA-directed RNA polymerase subunit RPC12/RpoP
MADVCDDAGEYNTVYQNAAMKTAGFDFEKGSPVLKPQTHPDFDGVHCVDCDVEIPAKRLAWGRVRCTECESRLELKKKTTGVR